MKSRSLLVFSPVLASVVLFAYVAFMSAWMAEDAFITLRTVDNFVGGHGLTWNVAERVQVYTHPLWMFMLSLCFAFTREAFHTSIFVGLGVSVSAVAFLAFRISRTVAGALLAIGLLTTSKAFVDYSTSGLENPLSHLLLAVFLAGYLRVLDTGSRHGGDSRQVYLVSLAACLCVLNRMDCALLVAPALAWLFMRSPGWARLGVIAAGFVPFIAWEIFSLFYYGFPFPNTAYAKLNTGILKVLLHEQGLHYVRNSLVTDPVTIPIILLGILLPFSRRYRRLLPLAIGMLLYLIYIIAVGGDFMSGRLFSAPFFCAVALVSRVPLTGARTWVPSAVIIAGLGLFAPHSPWRSGPDYGSSRDGLLDPHLIADERGYYFQRLGLYRSRSPRGLDEDTEAIKGRAARAKGKHALLGGNIGVFGYYAGPDVYVLDGFALADPLLSRLPIRSANWRIGHFVRRLPDGYFKSQQSGRNELENPRLRHFYSAIRTVTRGPLFAPGRFAEIWRLNTGAYKDTLAPFFAAHRHLQNGVRAVAREEFDEAVGELETAVALDAAQTEAWFSLYQLYLRAGRLPEAERALLAAIRLRPGRFIAELEGLAVAYRNASDPARARANEESAHNAYIRLGQWYEDNGRISEAIEQYESALRLPFDNSAVRIRLQALRQ